ncbi:hypothetical protein Thein_1924 [Thermodesulfatator indicus DSM 15286]|uniref:Uncharacterized protein n=1 Tax=Thermodesulfatator indicus (strain DSM 15286 / JCM 11887 / CIR29812) TaxID=667014 RepID=F8ACK4_THEID|nr:hypothetical protein [Thermodesulfatator indicus]AEH45779.1 hypothetical protein Thein_1924 [Thermodesulfatator indicus DSM 15286]
MGVIVYGTTGRTVEFIVQRDGIVLTDGDGTRFYSADPLEIGEVALLALTGQGPEGSKAWAAAEGERLLRAYWFLSTPGPGALRELVARVSAGVETNDLIREMERLAQGFTKRPIFGFREERLQIEVLTGGEDSSEKATGEGRGSYPVWLFGRFELSELVREAAGAARERLREEKLRLVGGMGVVSTDDGSGPGLVAGNAGVLRLSEDMFRKLRAFLLKVLYQEYGGYFREGTLSAYVPGRELRKVRRSGEDFWRAGVVIDIAGRRVRFTSPAEVARLLIFLI